MPFIVADLCSLLWVLVSLGSVGQFHPNSWLPSGVSRALYQGSSVSFHRRPLSPLSCALLLGYSGRFCSLCTTSCWVPCLLLFGLCTANLLALLCHSQSVRLIMPAEATPKPHRLQCGRIAPTAVIHVWFTGCGGKASAVDGWPNRRWLTAWRFKGWGEELYITVVKTKSWEVDKAWTHKRSDYQ